MKNSRGIISREFFMTIVSATTLFHETKHREVNIYMSLKASLFPTCNHFEKKGCCKFEVANDFCFCERKKGCWGKYDSPSKIGET